MTPRWAGMLQRAREALLAGRPQEALGHVESLLADLRQNPPDDAARAVIEERLGELRDLAEAALGGTRSAIGQIDEIIQSARSLRTYDRGGRRETRTVTTSTARRF